MDELIKGLMADPNDTVWNITQILSHRIYKQHGRRQLLVKIQWINNGNTWEHSEAICLQQPKILVAYALQCNLGNHKDWV